MKHMTAPLVYFGMAVLGWSMSNGFVAGFFLAFGLTGTMDAVLLSQMEKILLARAAKRAAGVQVPQSTETAPERSETSFENDNNKPNVG